jgi:hypothetical protein
MHWPGASIMVFIGILFPILVFLPVYLYFYVREKEESIINFLYIIFFLVALSVMTGFLSLDISRNMLADIRRVDDISDLSAYYKLKTAQIKVEEGNLDHEILQATEILLNYIHELKRELIIAAEESNREAITENKEIQTWRISNIYVRDVCIELLVEQGKGFILKEKLDGYYEYLNSIPGISNNTNLVFIGKLPGLVTIKPDEKDYSTWNIQHVNDPLIMVLFRLTQVENNIRLAAMEATLTLRT